MRLWKRRKPTDVEVSLRARLSDAMEAYAAMSADRDEHRAARARAEGTIAQFVASLDQVAVYEGMAIGPDSALLYLNELVRDHEELERRIDLAIMECSAADTINAPRLARILKGAVATPDGPPV